MSSTKLRKTIKDRKREMVPNPSSPSNNKKNHTHKKQSDMGKIEVYD